MWIHSFRIRYLETQDRAANSPGAACLWPQTSREIQDRTANIPTTGLHSAQPSWEIQDRTTNIPVVGSLLVAAQLTTSVANVAVPREEEANWFWTLLEQFGYERW